MTLRALLAQLLILLLVTLPLSAEQEPTDWHALAESLPPQALVTVRLIDGTRLQGYLLDVTDDTIVVQPKTRLRVEPRTIETASIRSLAPAKASSSPARKVVMVISGVTLTLAAIWMAMLMSYYGDHGGRADRDPTGDLRGALR